MTMEAEVSAAKPWTGSSLKMRCPMVLTIFQPPMAVPRAMAPAQLSLTQSGTCSVLSAKPKIIRARVMMPMVFCASLRPWLVAMKPADSSWSLRKARFTLLRCMGAQIQ